MAIRALFQALSIYVFAWASSSRMPASGASLRMAFPRYQDPFRRARACQARKHVFEWNRRCNEEKAAVQSSLYLSLVCFQTISQHILAGQALAALCRERYRETILLATC